MTEVRKVQEYVWVEHPFGGMSPCYKSGFNRLLEAFLIEKAGEGLELVLGLMGPDWLFRKVEPFDIEITEEGP